MAQAGATTAASATVSAAHEAADLIAAGRHIYREGILPSGRLLRVQGSAGVSRVGKDAACTACHRRSGYGTAEGQFVVRPIIGPDLYQTRRVVAANPRIAHQLGKPRRSPYDDASLARAIRTGVDVSGRILSENMPRYRLEDDEIAALVAYLKTLSAQPAPGVSDTEIHLATVMQPGVDPAKRSAMLEVLNSFVKDKNAGVRSEQARREVGTMRMQRAYRKWVLHVWDLHGPADGWRTQLESYYRQQPVFALVSGLGSGNWRPIHGFSEEYEVPCVFPQTDLPVVSGTQFYTVYLSKGVLLEAEVLAKYLQGKGKVGRLVQVFRPGDELSTGAAAAFRQAFGAADERLEDRPLDGPIAASFLQQLGEGVTDVVLWLAEEDASRARAVARAGEPSPTIYLSASILGEQAVGKVLQRDRRSLAVYPWDIPRAREARLLRTTGWLQHKGIATAEERVQVNTHFAIAVVGDVLAHMMDSFAREYFIEGVERVVTSTLMPSIFPHVSLGPGQRYAAKGGYMVVHAESDEDNALKPVSGWIVP